MNHPDQDEHWRSEKRLEAEAYAWFHDLFYDPEAEHAAGVRRRYRWQPQDRIEPFEVLHSQFGKMMSPWLIKDLSERLSKTSSNWRSRPDEFSGDEERSNTPIAAPSPNEIEVERAALLAAIAALEAAVAAIRNPKPLFGHNMPPEGLDDYPVSRRELDDLVVAIDLMREEARAKPPNPQIIAYTQSRLSKFAQTVMTWSSGRGTKFTDAVLETGGKAIGAAVVLKLTAILPEVYAVVAAAAKFVAVIARSIPG